MKCIQISKPPACSVQASRCLMLDVSERAGDRIVNKNNERPKTSCKIPERKTGFILIFSLSLFFQCFKEVIVFLSRLMFNENQREEQLKSL